jgi:hypothetical protein
MIGRSVVRDRDHALSELTHSARAAIAVVLRDAARQAVERVLDCDLIGPTQLAGANFVHHGCQHPELERGSYGLADLGIDLDHRLALAARRCSYEQRELPKLLETLHCGPARGWWLLRHRRLLGVCGEHEAADQAGILAVWHQRHAQLFFAALPVVDQRDALFEARALPWLLAAQ